MQESGAEHHHLGTCGHLHGGRQVRGERGPRVRRGARARSRRLARGGQVRPKEAQPLAPFPPGGHA